MPETVTSPAVALDHFTDREALIRHFRSYITGPPKDTILFLHGDGGVGKSLLSQYLKRYACKRFEDPQIEGVLQRADANTFHTRLRTSAGADVPAVYLDFGAAAAGAGDDVRLASEGLFALRNGLSRLGLRLPRFDFAAVWQLKEDGRLTRERLQALLPTEEVDLATAALAAFDAANAATYGVLKEVAKCFDKYLVGLRERAVLYRKAFRVPAEEIEEIEKMGERKVLLEALPTLLARDLNVAMRADDAPERLVLFFDTYDAFGGVTEQAHGGTLSDRWLRHLLQAAPDGIDLAAGVGVVMTGRGPPPWDRRALRYEPNPVTVEHLDLQRVGPFTEADANRYLHTAGVRDAGLRAAIIADVRTAPDQIHPLHLGLSVDIVRDAERDGEPLTAAAWADLPEEKQEDRGAWLVGRFLRLHRHGGATTVPEAVVAVSACRAFDRPLFRALAQRLLEQDADLEYEASKRDFQRIVGYSFVSAAADGRYRVHPLMQRYLRLTKPDLVREADGALLAHYEADTATPEARIEAIFHLNRLEPSQGVAVWVGTMRTAVLGSAWNEAQALAALHNDLIIKDDLDLSLSLQLKGEFNYHTSNYSEALTVFDKCVDSFQKCADFFSKATQMNNLSIALNNIGVVHRMIGDIYRILSDLTLSIQSYDTSIRYFSASISRNPSFAKPYSNKGTSIARKGQVVLLQKEYIDSVRLFTESFDLYRKAIQTDPYDPELYNNYGSALTLYVNCLLSTDQPVDALYACNESISYFEQSIDVNNDYPLSYSNLASAIMLRGNIYNSLGQHKRSFVSYIKSIEIFDNMISPKSHNISLMNNKGCCYMHIANLCRIKNDFGSSYDYTIMSIGMFDKSLRIAPNDPELISNKGNALKHLGQLLQVQGRSKEAMSVFCEAMDSFDHVLRLAPTHAPVRAERDRLQAILDQAGHDC